MPPCGTVGVFLLSPLILLTLTPPTCYSIGRDSMRCADLLSIISTGKRSIRTSL